MVDAALIEIEGVLFDTRGLRRTSLRNALLEHGFPIEPDAALADELTPRAAAAATLRAAEVPHDDVILDLVALSAERVFVAAVSVTGAALMPGALDFVRETAALARLAVVTRARRSEADALLRLASLDEFVSTVITADDALDAKPSPDSYRRALERLARQRPLSERNTIAIEDSVAGIRSARGAGIRCVAVGRLPAHIAMEADAYVESLVGQSVRALERLSRPGRERVQ
jgi:HAD superfamily hydrolase (TIGR01509 family)